jgi:hypothetical protein
MPNLAACSSDIGRDGRRGMVLADHPAEPIWWGQVTPPSATEVTMSLRIRTVVLLLTFFFASGVGCSDCQPCPDPSQLFCS